MDDERSKRRWMSRMFTSSEERQIIVVKSRQNSLGLASTIYSLGWLTRPSGWKKQHS